MTTHARNAKQIFLETVENHAPDDWSTYLDEACEGDFALRQDVELLLQAHQTPDSLLDGVAATLDSPEHNTPGKTIGNYKLREKLGEGGFGVVWAAEQSHPVRRKVAIKIIKPGMDSDTVVARFEAERQALALMDHPNIAKVLDAGATDLGRPYFVMELIRGVPITEYCDEAKLTIRQRLELFATVCKAIQHAHQKGIIHRDIKPQNVLITLHDGRPVPKVIDFGIAKALDQQLTDKTIYTCVHQAIGTLAYMSPEQAELSGLDVDTRADIYGLGVLLYELLTGATPLERKRLEHAAMHEACRIIREEEPERASSKISTLGESASAVSAHRSTDPADLTRLIRGDLDWILSKALEKERTRRYTTANEFADDIARHLNREAVLACPPSSLYRFRRFVVRNRLQALAATIVSISLLLGGMGISVGLYKSWQTEQRLKVLLSEYRDQLLEAATLLAFGGQRDRARDMANRLEGVLKELDPAYQQGAATSLLDGLALFFLGQEDAAKQKLDRAVELDPNAIAPNAIRAVLAVYLGDWAAYLDNIPTLNRLEPRSHLDEIFVCYGNLYADPPKWAKKLRKLVPEDDGSVFGQALTAAALAHAAVDHGNREWAQEAVKRAEIAEDLDPDSPMVQLMSLYAHDVAVQLAKFDGDDIRESLAAADERAERLGEYTAYGIGQYEVALYYEHTDRHAEALRFYRNCPMVREASDIISRYESAERAIEYVDTQRPSRYATLSRLILEIGRRPNEEIIEDYEKLTREESDLAFRMDALEIPLRMGASDLAARDAQGMLDKCKSDKAYEQLGYWVIPTAAHIAGVPCERSLAKSLETAESRIERSHAHFWIGMKHFCDGNRTAAEDSFQDCLKTGAFDYTYYCFSRTILSRFFSVGSAEGESPRNGYQKTSDGQ